MKTHPFALTVAGSIALLLSGCATKMSSDPNAPTSRPSGTVSFEGGQAAYWASATGGKGTLNFNGRSYGFTAVGVGAGGTGGQSVTATGKVYNLTSLSDFTGSYTSTRSGFTLIKGKVNAKLTNSHGVVIYMSGVTQGLASSGGVSTVTITLD
jgi:hypothetical protein